MLNEIIRLAKSAERLGEGGKRRDAIEQIVVRAAALLIDENDDAGNRRDHTAQRIAERVLLLEGLQDVEQQFSAAGWRRCFSVASGVNEVVAVQQGGVWHVSMHDELSQIVDEATCDDVAAVIEWANDGDASA